MDIRGKKIFVGCATVEAGNGGIARVARMMIKSLAGVGAELTVTSLIDENDIDVFGNIARTTKHSRLKYLAETHRAAISNDYFIYDSIGPARAHPRLPGLNRPYSVWIHGVEVWRALSRERMRVLENAETVFVNSQNTLDKFEALHKPLPNAKVCWLATEDNDPPAQQADFAGTPDVVVLGRIENNGFLKGHADLVSCWPAVVSKIPDARLIIAGGGDGLEPLRKLASESSVSDKIELLGRIPESEIPGLWKRAHLFAMPSKVEGFGLVYVEAMRHGVPVISSIHDAGKEVNAHGETGFCVNLETEGELASSIVKILKSRKRNQEFGAAAFKRWKDSFSYDSFEKRFLNIVESK